MPGVNSAMSVTVTRRLSYFFNSDPASGSQSLSADGDVFTVVLSPPLRIPKSVIACEVYVPQASIWNTSPNISATFSNNTFTFTTASAPVPGTYTFTIPEGLYSLDDIDSFIATQLVNLTLPSNLFVLSGDQATGRVILTFSLSGDSVDFTPATSVRSILGFAAAVFTAPSAGYSETGTSIATLNRNDNYLISGTFLTAGGIPINNNAPGVLASIPISIAPYSLINYSAAMPFPTPADELIGAMKGAFQFRLTNGSLAATPTGGGRVSQFWNFLLVIEYQELISPQAQRSI